MTISEKISKLSYEPNGVCLPDEDSDDDWVVVSYLLNNGILYLYMYDDYCYITAEENDKSITYLILNYTIKGLNDIISKYRSKLIRVERK